MLNDIAHVWWAIFIAYTLHQICWWVLQLLFANAFRRNIGWSILPDILVGFGSINLFFALISWWNVPTPANMYAAFVYIFIANGYAFIRYIQSKSSNGRRVSVYWWAGLSIGFLVFGLERLILG